MLIYDVQNLTKYYPKQSQPANKDITLQIQAGEISGILGDNGAGKTTRYRRGVAMARQSQDAMAARVNVL